MSQQTITTLPAEPTSPIKSALSTDSLPPDLQFCHWRESIAPLFDASLLNKEVRFIANAHAYLVNSLTCGFSSYNAQSFMRNRAWRARFDQDNILVQLYLSGGFSGYNGNNHLDITAGDICILDLGKNLHTQSADSSSITVSIPRSLARQSLKLEGLKGGLVLAKDNALNAVIAQHMRMTMKMLEHATMEQARLLTDAFLAMMRTTFAIMQPASAGAEGYHCDAEPRLDHICGYIQQHLTNPQFGVEDVCRRFHLSRASVYRILSPLGGVRQYIFNLRMQRCFLSLQEELHHFKTISAVAYHWGFNNYSHFSRSFKDHFGLTPREVTLGSHSINDPALIMSAGRKARVPTYSHWFSLK